MKTTKLSTTDGFVLLDLPDAPFSAGVVRSAPKILQGGAEMLARSVTYGFAAFGMQAGGASAGVNAKPEDRTGALAAFATEVAAMGNLIFDAGRGVEEGDLAPLRAQDPRPANLLAVGDVASGSDELVAAGALTGAQSVIGALSGKRLAIEGFGPVGVALARQAQNVGAQVVAVATGAGTMLQPAGFDPAVLAEAWLAGGEAMVKSLEGDAKPAWAVWGADADVVFAGSKAGAMTHEGAAYVRAGAIVPIGPVPITAKSLAVLRRAGVTYVPDFVSMAAPLLVGFGGVTPQGSVERIADLIGANAAHPDGLFLACCSQAEAYLASWQDHVPFGRPLA